MKSSINFIAVHVVGIATRSDGCRWGLCITRNNFALPVSEFSLGHSVLIFKRHLASPLQQTIENLFTITLVNNRFRISLQVVLVFCS